VRRDDGNGAHRHTTIQQRGEGEITAVPNLDAGRGHGFVDVGPRGEHLEFGFEAALFQKFGLVHDHVDGVLTREWSLPAKTERPPAFLFQPGNRFVGNFLVWLRPTPVREALGGRWKRTANERDENHDGHRAEPYPCWLVHFTPPHFLVWPNVE